MGWVMLGSVAIGYGMLIDRAGWLGVAFIVAHIGAMVLGLVPWSKPPKGRTPPGDGSEPPPNMTKCGSGAEAMRK